VPEKPFFSEKHLILIFINPPVVCGNSTQLGISSLHKKNKKQTAFRHPDKSACFVLS